MTLRMQIRENENQSFYSNSFTFSDQNILKIELSVVVSTKWQKPTTATTHDKNLLDQFLKYLYRSVNVTHPDPHYQNTEP